MKKGKKIDTSVFDLSNKQLNQVNLRNSQLKYVNVTLLIFTFCFLLAIPASAQYEEEEIPKGIVPPPLNVISKDERKQLNAETKMKKRTKLALDLMNARLLKSESLLKEADYQNSLDQIGKFQGLLINTLKFLKQNQSRRGVHKNFKRFEINLRKFMPRLELIRREMPYKYGWHVKKMLFFVREARTKALNPLFEDTVLPEGSN